ncbi:MAG: hypothetical protein HQK83_14775 [Fibrobacteria bacterium]|nr:hypothetical protein [Fibrobacteria bacterium]
MQLSIKNIFVITGLAIFTILSNCGDSEETTSPYITPYTSVGRPEHLPKFSSLSLYTPNSPFNKKISLTPEIDPNSKALVNGLSEAGNLILQVKKYTSPVFFADDNTQRYDIELACGSEWELGISIMKDVPIPDWAEPGFDGEPGDPHPTGCGKGPDQDNHMVILDLTTRCEYDFWQTNKIKDKWIAGWGNSLPMDSNGVFPKGLSSRGSGFAFLGGVIWPDELQAENIEHVLVFNYPFPKSGGPVSPATDSDGESERSDALPEGALLQLNPDLNLDSLNLTPYEKTIAKALQEYGMILADGGGSNDIGLYAINALSTIGNPYQDILPDEAVVSLSNIPVQEFQVLKMQPQVSDWQDKMEVTSSSCGTMQ